MRYACHKTKHDDDNCNRHAWVQVSKVSRRVCCHLPHKVPILVFLPPVVSLFLDFGERKVRTEHGSSAALLHLITLACAFVFLCVSESVEARVLKTIKPRPGILHS